jgi:GrpB-like predicted nucleotidyltransferase (UPF0157 family)/predicted RNA-binding protein associated with RNAse of E/G family
MKRTCLDLNPYSTEISLVTPSFFHLTKRNILSARFIVLFDILIIVVAPDGWFLLKAQNKDKGKTINVRRPVVIVDYDPRWPTIYSREKDRILRVVGNKVVAMEHVGSTAVPGLGAKPIIDIMVAVRQLSEAEECIEPLKTIGYEYVPEYEKELPERRYFRKGPEGVRNRHFHLHMVQHGGDFWKQHLMFRDYLRCHRDVARQYWELKSGLADKHSLDREAYTKAKTCFIESILMQAAANPTLHLRYARLPTQVLEMYNDLVYQSKKVIVGRSQITSTQSIEFDGKTVLHAGFPVTYFELLGKWFSIVKVRNLRGEHTGYYCDITTLPRLLKDGSVEVTDLFLDLWVSPDLRYKVLDQDELEEAVKKTWVSKQLYARAKRELKKLVALVETKDFPPRIVRQLERRLKL